MTSPPRFQWPLSEILSTGDDPEAEARLRERIQARLHRSSERRVSLRVAASLAAVALLSLLWVAQVSLEPKPPLVLLSTSGEVFHSLGSAASEGTSRVQFQDGSSIEVSPGGAVRGLGSNGQTMATLVERGRVRFEVTPGGPRRWVVEAGLLSVEVLGTEFSVERTEGSVFVDVYRGAVVVRSDLLKDGVHRLSAGERVKVVAPESYGGRGAAVENTSIEDSAPLEEVTEFDAPDDLRTLKPSGRTDDKPQVRARAKTAEAWMRSADEARSVGDIRGAILALEALLAEHPDDQRASFARFQLARWYLADGRNSQAESLFRQVAQGMGPLSEDASLRLVELKRDQGSFREASGLARAYLERFPQGRHRRLMESFVLP